MIETFEARTDLRDSFGRGLARIRTPNGPRKARDPRTKQLGSFL